MSGPNGRQEASWSEEFDRKELREAACDLDPTGSPFPGHRLHGRHFQHHLLQYGMLTLKSGSCTAVMQYSSTSYDSIFFPAVSMCYSIYVHPDFNTICVSNPT